MNPSNKRSIPLLVLFLLALSVLLYHSTIFLPPSFIHAWTQSERYAISLQFLNNGFDLFHPATFNLQTIEGITRMDFPLNEYIVAILMKIFGTTSPVIFRMYTLCISITGLIFLYLLAKKITSSELKAYLVVAFVFLSPLYTYYQAGFIPCVPAIAFVFIAYYFLYNYKLDGKRKHFYWSIFFFLLAAMIRLPFFIFLFALLLQQSYLPVKQKKFARHEVFGFLIAFGLFAAYYRYNVHVGMIYGNMFLDRFLPAKSIAEFVEIIKHIYNHWLLQYYTFWHILLLFIALVYSVVAFRKARTIENKAMWFNLFLVGGGSVLYFLLMTCQYFDHDYYFLDSLFVPVVLLFLYSIKNINIEKQSGKLVFFFIACIFVMFMYGDSRKNQFERYTYSDSDRVEVTRRNFAGSEEFLDSIGVSKKARMLVIDSYSTNIPLYMMNRRGYTVYQTSRDNAALTLFWAKWDYVVIQDEFLFSDVLKYYPIVATVIEPVAGNGKISVYKRTEKIRSRSFSELLQLENKKKVQESIRDFEGADWGRYTITENIIYSDDFKSNVAVLDSVTEFGVSYKIGANELKEKTNLSVLVSCNFLCNDNSAEIKMVAATDNKGKTIYYQSYLLKDYYSMNNTVQKAYFYFVLPDFKNANDILTIYLWNPSKKYALYDDFKVVIYKNR